MQNTQHPDDAAVDALATAMKAKLAKQRAKGYGGWNDKVQCSQQFLSALLRRHVDKGDPVDVANFCAFLLARGEAIAAAQQAVQADAPLPLLLRDIARDLGITVPQACIALKPLGNYSTNSAVTAEMARMLRDHFPVPAHPAEGVPAQAEPFMWAIQEPGGSAYMDKNCVSTSRGIVEAEVDGLNLGLDADDEPYKVVPVYLAATQPADGVPAQAFKTKVYQALGIGSACDEHVAFANIENLIRREHCLSAIEREFFMVETPPDEGEGDTGPGEECLLNWGSTPEQYVKQFAEAIAATHSTQQGMDAQDAIRALIAQHGKELEKNEHAYFELAYTRSTGWMAWITDKPLCSPVVNPDRKVLASGQGDTPEAACADALAAQAKQGGM